MIWDKQNNKPQGNDTKRFMNGYESVLIFVLAGLCEIGGGYLIWLWLKENKPWWYALIGAFVNRQQKVDTI